MSDDSNNPSSNTGQPRRSSFASDTFASIFGTRRSNSISNRPGAGASSSSSSSDSANGSQPIQQFPGPITTAAAQAHHRRRLSLTTLGLSASSSNPSSSSAMSGFRRESAGSNNSGSIDESAVEDELATAGPTPHTPFGRRMSFGARALRDVRSSSGGGGGGGGNGGGEQNEGFNWSDNFSSRAKRTSIVAGHAAAPPLSSSAVSSPASASGHVRAKSVATMEAPPAQEMPKPREPNRPDHFQERILKGDFYMD